VNSQPRARRLDLDRAKGLGIFLVVVGHLAAKTQPKDNLWFTLLQTGLYEFHMPFFMYLSGYVSYLSGAARTSRLQWTTLFKRRVTRLLLPFALFGLVLIVGKIAAAHFMHVDNAPLSLGQALFGMLWDTDKSPAISVWYIAVVFVLTVITPPIMWAVGGRTWILIILTGILYLLPIPHVMYLDRVARFFIFFSLGGLAADGGTRWLKFIDRSYLLWLAMLVALVTIALTRFDSFSDATRLFVCGVASMPALHGLVRRSELSSSTTLITLGAMSFVIYLLNTPFIGLVKGALLKLMPWDGANFFMFFFLMLAAGLYGPILVKRYVLRRLPPLDRITD